MSALSRSKRRASTRALLLPLALVSLWMVVAGAARAQQPTKELEDLRETTRILWQAQDYAAALKSAEKALPLVVREFGAEHEQTALQYFSLGLIAQAAGNLAVAERHFGETVRLREKVYGA